MQKQVDSNDQSGKKGPGRRPKVEDKNEVRNQRQMADRLRELVDKFYATQNDFAEIVKLDPAVVSKLLTGKLALTNLMTNRISRATGFSADYIKDGKGPEKSTKPMSITVPKGHQGKSLERYATVNAISWTMLAGSMGKKLPGVSEYKTREQFRASTRHQILAGLRSLGLNPVEDEVFRSVEPLIAAPFTTAAADSVTEQPNIQADPQIDYNVNSYAKVPIPSIIRGQKQAKYYLLKFLTRFFTKTAAYERGDELTPSMDSYLNEVRTCQPDLAYFTANQIESSRTRALQSTRFAVGISSELESYQVVLDKIQDYFIGGAQLVWYVIPWKQRIDVYTSPDESKPFKGADVISAAPVLPDFQFIVADLFA